VASWNARLHDWTWDDSSMLLEIVEFKLPPGYGEEWRGVSNENIFPPCYQLSTLTDCPGSNSVRRLIGDLLVHLM